MDAGAIVEILERDYARRPGGPSSHSSSTPSPDMKSSVASHTHSLHICASSLLEEKGDLSSL